MEYFPNLIPIVNPQAVLYSLHDSFYVYHSRNNRTLQLSKSSHILVKSFNGQLSLSQILKKLTGRSPTSEEQKIVTSALNSLLEAEVLRLSDSPSSLPTRIRESLPNPVPKLIWALSFTCNLNCVHCYYESSADAPEGISEGLILNTADNLEKQVLRVTITGGEPLRFNALGRLAKTLTAKGIGVRILTNGTLVTEKLASSLAEAQVYDVRVSLDGTTPEVHDWFRGRRGAFQKAIRGIQLLTACGVPVTVNTTVTKNCIHQITGFPELLQKLKVKRWNTAGLLPLGRARTRRDLDLSTEEYIQYLQFALSLRRNPALDGVIEVDCGIRALEPASERLPCFDTRHSLFIDPYGIYRPCYLIDHIELGRVSDGDLPYQIYHSEKLAFFRKSLSGHNLKECLKCRHLKVCGGGCRYVAKEHGKGLLGKDPLACKLYHEILPSLLTDTSHESAK